MAEGEENIIDKREFMDSFVDILNENFDDMETEFVGLKDDIHMFLDDLEEVHVSDLEDDKRDFDLYDRFYKIYWGLLTNRTLFSTAIMIGDYFYSIYFPNDVREHMKQYLAVETDESEIGEVLQMVSKAVLEDWYCPKYDSTLEKKAEKGFSVGKAGEKVRFPPLLVSLVAFGYEKEKLKDLFDHFTNHYEKTISFFSDEKQKYLTDSADARAKGKAAMSNKLIEYLKKIEANNAQILEQIKKLKKSFNEWYKDFDGERSEEVSKAVLEDVVNLWKGYKTTTVPYLLICLPIINELCSLATYSELLPLDKKP